MPHNNSQIELPNPIIVQPQITQSFYQITDVTDSPEQKTVIARVLIGEGHINFYTVWVGEEYDNIGQWTDTDLQSALTPMILSSYPPAT